MWITRFVVLPPVVVASFCLGFATPASADYLGSYLKVECQPDRNRANILPLGAWSPIPFTPPSMDCTFNNGRHVRAKYGEGPPDRAGLPSSTWVSIWIDKVKIVSRAYFGCWGEGRCSLYFEISADGYKTCRVEPESTTPQGFKALGTYKCDFTPNGQLGKEIDVAEFPPEGQAQGPPPGYAAIIKGDYKFCQDFKAMARWGKGWRVPAPSHIERSSKGWEYMSFDIDNDDRADDVYHAASTVAHLPSERFYVYQEDNNPVASLWPQVDYQTFKRDTVHVTYPDVWGYEVGLFYLKPVRYEGKTYMILQPYLSEYGEITRVLMPLPGGEVSEVCAYKVVQDNY